MNRKKILLLEDDNSAREVISDALRLQDYLVFTAEDGLRALEMLQRSSDDQPIDMVITDLVMPRVGGIEFLQELKNKEISVPVLVITGQLDSDLKDKLDNLGHRIILQKPFKIDLLTEAVESLLSG